MTDSEEPSSESDQRRWQILLLLSIAELLGMSLWLTANAVAPSLSERWGLTEGQAATLTTMVQIGFVVGTAVVALLNLADLLPARWFFAVCAVLASCSNAAIIFGDSYSIALACRFLVGVFLAGVYPPAMKMVATWFRTSRGFAIGTVVGALTCGKALPYLISALDVDNYASVIMSSSIGAAIAAVLVLSFYRDGPHAFPTRPFRLAAVWDVLRDQRTRLAIGGYLGHMWELYAMWVWLPVFITASFQLNGYSSSVAKVASFVAVAAGAVGCVWGGWAADRIGRERLVNLCLAVSGISAVLIGMSFGANPWIVATLATVWGFFVVADSAQFSTLVTEVSAPERVGTALTLQTSIGFLLTTVTIKGVGALQEQPAIGWRWAFAILAIGPALGIVTMMRLARMRNRAREV